jgi:hypothetical protein
MFRLKQQLEDLTQELSDADLVAYEEAKERYKDIPKMLETLDGTIFAAKAYDFYRDKKYMQAFQFFNAAANYSKYWARKLTEQISNTYKLIHSPIPLEPEKLPNTDKSSFVYHLTFIDIVYRNEQMINSFSAGLKRMWSDVLKHCVKVRSLENKLIITVLMAMADYFLDQHMKANALQCLNDAHAISCSKAISKGLKSHIDAVNAMAEESNDPIKANLPDQFEYVHNALYKYSIKLNALHALATAKNQKLSDDTAKKLLSLSDTKVLLSAAEVCLKQNNRIKDAIRYYEHAIYVYEVCGTADSAAEKKKVQDKLAYIQRLQGKIENSQLAVSALVDRSKKGNLTISSQNGSDMKNELKPDDLGSSFQRMNIG